MDDYNQVFLVVEDIPYEPGGVKAVFSTEEKAKAWIERTVPDCRRDITFIEDHWIDCHE